MKKLCLGICMLGMFSGCFETGPRDPNYHETGTAPTDTSLAGLDSLGRAVATMMQTYFGAIDSSLKVDPLKADTSFELPDLDRILKDTSTTKPHKASSTGDDDAGDLSW